MHALVIFSHVTFTTILWSQNYYYHHPLSDGVTKIQKQGEAPTEPGLKPAV